MPAPLIGIVMGSDSDLPVMEAAANVCKDFNIDYELTVVSAHRTPMRPGLRRQKPAHHANGGGLARAVRPQKAIDRPLRHIHVKAVDNLAAAKDLGQTLDRYSQI